MQSEERKYGNYDREQGRRVFGVILRGEPEDFQLWLELAKTYGLYIVFSKSTRTSKLVIEEVGW